MALNRIQAARVLSDKEMALFESSLADHASDLSDRELAASIGRLRTQRDKHRDLLRRQRVATRSRTGTKGGTSGQANDRTRQKAEAFEQALERLEKQQQRREAARSRAERANGQSRGTARTGGHGNPAGPSRKASARPPGSSGGPRSATQAPRALAKRQQMQASGQERTLAHVSSRGRRSQARRDSR
jgi:hypothetical protein